MGDMLGSLSLAGLRPPQGYCGGKRSIVPISVLLGTPRAGPHRVTVHTSVTTDWKSAVPRAWQFSRQQTNRDYMQP